MAFNKQPCLSVEDRVVEVGRWLGVTNKGLWELAGGGSSCKGGGLTSCRIGIGGLLGMIADVMAAGDWVEADARGLIQTGRRRDK